MVNTQLSKLPRHIAIIMDGNGRWAKERGLSRIEGHRAGTEKTDEIITCAREAKIRYLTLYAFSKENWNRPPDEVSALMDLLKQFLSAKEEKMVKNEICLRTIGNTSLLPEPVSEVLQKVIDSTAQGKEMTLTLALSYSSRDEIIRGIKRFLDESRRQTSLEQTLTEESFGAYLDTADLPDPDLIIRTSGEHRISNFLLWQGAYAEFVFEECHWPDYTPAHFLKALEDYARRERRFGLTSEQLR